MAKRNEDELAIGEDSFMDTIANLVGIMIILVVIVGAKGYDAARALAREEAHDQIQQLQSPTSQAENLDRDLDDQLEELEKYEIETAYRNAERLTLVDRKTLIDQEIRKRLAQLDQDAQEAFEVEAQAKALERDLEKLIRSQGDLPEVQKQVIALQHLPTPMAKTVFGKELHVMLRDHQLTVIPWDLLVDQLKSSARATASRNSQRDKFEDVLGPIDGFLMRQGRLRGELDSSRSSHTTVTVWVDPESFAEFRMLKELLYKEGYLCAARPLPRDMRIGASPQGSSSTAQ